LSLPPFDTPALNISHEDQAAGHIRSENEANALKGAVEGDMCPICIASAAVMAAGAGSTGGILAVCIGKFRNFFRVNRLGLFQKIKER
jgi:hypothetical protein